MTKRERILVMSHGHPELIRGGGEIAAYNLYETYKSMPRIEDAWFLARADAERGASGRIRMHREKEYLWEQGLSNAFTMKAANQHEVTGYFKELIELLKPTVIHTHHYFLLGLEYLKVIKDIDPDITLIMTLHEYMAICPNAGSFLKPGTGQICRSGNYRDHLDCAEGKSPEDHWLRKHRFDTYFSYVDRFIAPSQFLADRYIEWGLSKDRITVLPNGQPETTPLAPRPLAEGEGRNRFAFFGQINANKGLDVLLAGLAHLKPSERRSIVLEVHGANLDLQSEDFQKRIKTLAKPLLKDGTLIWRGGYMPSELPDRMAQTDWVLVPSVWYENAPMIIQEAFGFGRPVVVSNLGGMKEAVSAGQGGLTLPHGNSQIWAKTMQSLSEETQLWDNLRASIPRPKLLSDVAKDILDLCQEQKSVTI
jgi:glycosyltransferase involved in cell wall biosynthesis